MSASNPVAGNFNNEAELRVLHAKLDHLIKLIGEKDAPGTGGTGLAGELARSNHETDQRFEDLNKKIGHLYSLKHVGVGILVTVGGLGTLLMAGAKSVVADWIK